MSVWLLWLQRRDGSVWLQRGPLTGVWAGLYCFPSFDSRAALEQCLPDRLSGQAMDLPAFKHVLTHKDLHLHPVRLEMPRSAPPGMEGQWFGTGDWPGLGLPGFALALVVSRTLGLGLHVWLWHVRLGLDPRWPDWWQLRRTELAAMGQGGVGVFKRLVLFYGCTGSS